MLTNLAAVKTMMRLAPSVTTNDAAILDAIGQVDRLVKNYLDRNIEKILAPVAPAIAASATAGTGLISGTTYYYVMTSLNANGETLASNEASVTPSGNNLQVTLTWGQVGAATGYSIYRGLSSGQENVLVTSIQNAGVTSYVDAGAIVGGSSPPAISTAVAGMTEYLNGEWTDGLVLRDPPLAVSDIIAVYEDPSGVGGQSVNSFPPTTLLTAGADYFLETDRPDGLTSYCGILRRINTVWRGRVAFTRGQLGGQRRPGQRNIKVQHTGGYAVVPADLQRTASVLAVRLLSEGGKGFIYSTESFEDRSTTLPAGDGANNLFTPDIVSRLALYRRPNQ